MARISDDWKKLNAKNSDDVAGAEQKTVGTSLKDNDEDVKKPGF